MRFLERMLCPNPNTRATIDELMEDPWITGNDCNESEVKSEISARVETMNKLKDEEKRRLSACLEREKGL